MKSEVKKVKSVIGGITKTIRIRKNIQKSIPHKKDNLNNRNNQHDNFYMWLSNIYQCKRIQNYKKVRNQNNLFNNKTNKKIEVELYISTEKSFVRESNNSLNINSCAVKGRDNDVIFG